MPIFLSSAEKQAIVQTGDPVVKRFRKALALRVGQRAQHLGLPPASTQWWYPVAEYLSDAAMQHALAPSPGLAAWLRATTLAVARRPLYDWVGPWFRSHATPPTGHLETAHLCWGVASVIDLAPEVFPPVELEEVKQSLHDQGLVLCRRWLHQNHHLANWRGIMASGALVAAAALGQPALVAEFLPEVQLLGQAFQPDGSYGESIQYGNYLANALMLAYEALARAHPDLAQQLDIEAYGRGMAWLASSMFYPKPLAGWGDQPVARAANFNDAAAIFRPSGDLLLHLAARLDARLDARAGAPNAGLARWLFQEYYEPCPLQGPHDLATFGMKNDWGFLALPLLTQAGAPVAPAQAGLPLTHAFSNGNAFVRDQWPGRSILAIQAGNNDGCHAPGHLQGDLNSFILAFGQERLLIDAGHSCYRNLAHGLESSTQTHNTCTFLLENEALGLQEDLAKIKLLEQKNVLPRRRIANGQVEPPVERGGRLRHCGRLGEVSLVVSEVAASYGPPIDEFLRAWVQVGAHLTLVVDRIRASEPVRPVWNWLVNNRDQQTIWEREAHQLSVYRHQVGLKLANANGLAVSGPSFAYAHDAYHPEPNQPGEGQAGSGLLFRHTAPEKQRETFGLHLIAADELALIDEYTFDLAAGPGTVRIHTPQGEVELATRRFFPLQLQLGRAGQALLIEERPDGSFALTQSPAST